MPPNVDPATGADDATLLAELEASWERLAADPEALAAYRAEMSHLDQFDAPLPAD